VYGNPNGLVIFWTKKRVKKTGVNFPFITKKGLVPSKPLFSVSEDVTSGYYRFLCAAQNLDLPFEVFLHLFPALVFAGHLSFFVLAIIFSPSR
jgi:hypothetical protein